MTINQPDLSRHRIQRQRMNVMVVARNLDKPEEMTRKVINWRSQDDREWLDQSHNHWAMNNRHSITLIPLTDEEAEQAKLEGVRFSF